MTRGYRTVEKLSRLGHTAAWLHRGLVATQRGFVAPQRGFAAPC